MTDDDKSTDDMNAQEQQNYFNELAEKMVRGEITADEAIDIYKTQQKRLEEAEEEVRCMERRWTKSYECVEILTETKEKLEGLLTMLTNFNTELKEELKKTKEELAAHRDTFDEQKHIIIPIYWGIDEETGKKIYDTDEMRDEFENAMGDFETDEYAECCDCGKELEGDEHTQLDADGRCVCDDCFKGEESGEE